MESKQNRCNRATRLQNWPFSSAAESKGAWAWKFATPSKVKSMISRGLSRVDVDIEEQMDTRRENLFLAGLLEGGITVADAAAIYRPVRQPLKSSMNPLTFITVDANIHTDSDDIHIDRNTIICHELYSNITHIRGTHTHWHTYTRSHERIIWRFGPKKYDTHRHICHTHIRRTPYACNGKRSARTIDLFFFIPNPGPPMVLHVAVCV